MNKFMISILVFLVAILAVPVSAQSSEPPPGPVYIVQAGDTLWDIAVTFDVSVDDLIDYNSLSGQDIFVGDRLVIPGFEDISGVLTTKIINLGETFHSICHDGDVESSMLIRINHLVSPVELFAGYELITIQSDENDPPPEELTNIRASESFLEMAVRNNRNTWELVLGNNLDNPSRAIPADAVKTQDGSYPSVGGGVPSVIESLLMEPLPLTQGQTVQLSIKISEPAVPTGVLIDYPLNFIELDNGAWISLQGVHVMTEPGLYPLSLKILLPDGTTQVFEQLMLVKSGNFSRDPVLLVEPSTIDPEVTEPENEFLNSLILKSTPQQLWLGLFRLPVDDQFCIRSMYGNRRSYNGSDFIYFHTGVDYGVCSESHPFDIYAPAAGKVIFTGALAVRGNATIIDHGWGVFSGLWHQEEIFVSVGDSVTAGQLIGKIGATGRVTGAHLHWEVWVNGVQVNPLQWLEELFPRE